LLLDLDSGARVCCGKPTVLQVMKTMLNIGDYALHKTTGKLGQVVAYGHEILDSVYLPTLKVEVVSDTQMGQKTYMEDLTSKWVPVEKEAISNN
jgi:hypothetical protein